MTTSYLLFDGCALLAGNISYAEWLAPATLKGRTAGIDRPRMTVDELLTFEVRRIISLGEQYPVYVGRTRGSFEWHLVRW